MNTISIIGDGGWGTALALIAYNKGLKPVLWSVSSEYVLHMKKVGENVKFLKGVALPGDLNITSNDNEVDGSEYVIFAVPCEYLKGVAERFSGKKIGTVISATKGIENGSLKRPSEILSEIFPVKDIAVLSGPTIAYEVAKGMPTTVVVASSGDNKKGIQQLLMADSFRVYDSPDPVGVELGGALKNIVAIAAGISDGLGFGANTKAAILTRGLAEMMRLGDKLGADKLTFSGLSGIGDLATTCISERSRNRWFGEEVGKGKSVSQILSRTEMVVEGYLTSKSAYQLAKVNKVDMPITEKIYEVLYGDKSPALAVKELMSRSAKQEHY